MKVTHQIAPASIAVCGSIGAAAFNVLQTGLMADPSPLQFRPAPIVVEVKQPKY
ncbi:MAG: hypothetical protein ABSH35_20960 [Isosphaeraceae bacterium]